MFYEAMQSDDTDRAVKRQKFDFMFIEDTIYIVYFMTNILKIYANYFLIDLEDRYKRMGDCSHCEFQNDLLNN
jgi:hypothetical protein